MRHPQKSVRTAEQERIDVLAEVARKSARVFRPAREVLRTVRAVPTIFPQLDFALRVGGWPIERIATLSGPSAEGKSSCANGIGLSFLRRGHFYKLIDAERSTPVEWLATWFGADVDSPAFSASRPETYEAAVDEVREWATVIGKARAKGQLPPDTSGLVVVDSIRKLVPKGFVDKVAKAASEKTGVDGFGGRGAQIKAALHAAWLDELVPLLEQTGTALIFITRESENVGAGLWEPDFKITGGKALVYDASLVLRIERSWVYGPGAEGERKPVYGERHRVTVTKSKVSRKEGKTLFAQFHTSNGVFTPEGFDLARDLVDLGKTLGVIKASDGGGWLSWQGCRWNGEHSAVRKLYAEPAKLAALDVEVRARFADADVVSGVVT